MLVGGTHLCDCFESNSNAHVTQSEVSSWKHTIALFSTLISILPYSVLPYLECCLERHTGILLHQCHSTILSPHYALTAPDCSLQAGRPPSGLSLFLCLTNKNSHRWTIDHSQCLWVLIVEQTALTWHCMLSCLIDLSVHWILSSGSRQCVFVCDCARIWIVYIRFGSSSIYKIISFAWFSLLGVPKCWILPHSVNRDEALLWFKCLV